MSNEVRKTSVVISFVDRYFTSPAFENFFKEGMALVEETAVYLDHQGREDSKKLGKTLQAVYATETMRLTTRLMQIAGWLLLMRSKKDGDMSSDQIARERLRTRLSAIGTSDEVLSRPLPEKLLDLIRRSLKHIEEARRLDERFFRTHQ